jgi:CRISPR-associated protein Csm2
MYKQNLDGVTDLAGLSPQDINSIADYQGNQLYDTIKTNQVRNIYSSILAIRTKIKNENEAGDGKKISPEIERDLILLKPKLAYATGRQKGLRPFHDLIVKAIDLTVKSEDQVKGLHNFISLVEAFVAYHKFYGGKDK